MLRCLYGLDAPFWRFFSSAASSSGLGGARRSTCPAVTISIGEGTMDRSFEQLVRNQILLREVNERVAEVADTWAGEPPKFLCECSNTDCVETIALSQSEYETVRSSPNLFVLLPGHELSEVDRIVETAERFCLVEKTKHTELVLSWHRDAPAKAG